MDLLIGFLMGVAVVAPVGPVSVLLISIGIERGRRDGVRAGLGVAGADVVLIIVVLALSHRLAALDPAWQARVHTTIGICLLVVAGHGLVSRTGMASIVERIRHPFRTLMMATLANPMTLAVWLGLSVAIGARATGPVALALQAAGLMLATVVWHTGLGTLAGWAGPLLGTRGRQLLQRASALAMLGVGVMLVG